MSNKNKKIPFAEAICYSGYRKGQSPRANIFPDYQQVKEDLLLISKVWSYVRLYDISKHAEVVLNVITKEKLNIQVMIGNDLKAEVNNPGCPWGAQYNPKELTENAEHNQNGVKKLIKLANRYPEIVFSASIGNEASVEWTDHLVPTNRLIDYAKQLKAGITQTITFCENYVPWSTKLKELVDVLDFISIHTYPVWEYKSVEEALSFTIENYNSVKEKYPDKEIIITEAGWTTNTNGKGIEKSSVSEEFQARHIKELVEWSRQENILTFLFEAFDEPWKGSEDLDESEKHWGLFFENRKPKLVAQELFGF